MKHNLLSLLIPTIALSACSKPIGGHLTISANELSTETSVVVSTFSENGFKFEYLGLKNDGNGNFVFASNNSYIQSINGRPDSLMRFKTPNAKGDFIVYGLIGSDIRSRLRRKTCLLKISKVAISYPHSIISELNTA